MEWGENSSASGPAAGGRLDIRATTDERGNFAGCILTELDLKQADIRKHLEEGA